jgi:hypothetical protein
VRYEDMLERPQEAFAGISAHLALQSRPEQLARAVEMASFANLQGAERKDGFSERPRDNTAFFRAGQAGQWRDRLTGAQVDRITASHREQMQRFGYSP